MQLLPVRAAWGPIPRAARDGLGVAAFAAGYFGVRAATRTDVAAAHENARHLVRLERALHLPSEVSLQAHVVDHRAVLTVLNWVYVWGHWPVIVAVLWWLARAHRPEFVRVRDALLVSGAVGLVVFAVFPVAPPRLAGWGMLDSVSEYSHSYRLLQPPSLANLYAAMPSLHVGWDLLVGVALWRCGRHRLIRAAGVVLPLLMWASVVLTANHYLLDGVAGDAAALLGLRAADWRARRGGWRPVPAPHARHPPHRPGAARATRPPRSARSARSAPLCAGMALAPVPPVRVRPRAAGRPGAGTGAGAGTGTGAVPEPASVPAGGREAVSLPAHRLPPGTYRS